MSRYDSCYLCVRADPVRYGEGGWESKPRVEVWEFWKDGQRGGRGLRKIGEDLGVAGAAMPLKSKAVCEEDSSNSPFFPLRGNLGGDSTHEDPLSAHRALPNILSTFVFKATD